MYSIIASSTFGFNASSSWQQKHSSAVVIATQLPPQIHHSVFPTLHSNSTILPLFSFLPPIRSVLHQENTLVQTETAETTHFEKKTAKQRRKYSQQHLCLPCFTWLQNLCSLYHTSEHSADLVYEPAMKTPKKREKPNFKRYFLANNKKREEITPQT